MQTEIIRGDTFYADLDPIKGSEQGGIRPVLIIQNNVGNKHAETVIVAPISSKITKKTNLPTHRRIKETFLGTNSVILFEQIKTIDKGRLGDYLGRVSTKKMYSYGKAIKISVGLSDPVEERKRRWKKKK